MAGRVSSQIRRFIPGNRTTNVFYVPSKKDLFTDPTQDDIVVSADKYVREIGPDAFSGYGYVQESLPQETIQYIQGKHVQVDMYLILLTASSQAFFHLKECR
ncbi:hypothetical protein Hdeb2414_s0010g00344261 [Helianthus debilis subsp. tardiflorus]